jgi:hypothetical protein
MGVIVVILGKNIIPALYLLNISHEEILYGIWKSANLGSWFCGMGEGVLKNSLTKTSCYCIA